MTFSEKMKNVRIILSISQEQLARELNVSFATINRLETNKTLPSYSTVQAFEMFCKKNNIFWENEND